MVPMTAKITSKKSAGPIWFVLPAALLLLCASCASIQDRRDWPVEISSRHFHLRTSAPEGLAREYLNFLEAALQAGFGLLEMDPSGMDGLDAFRVTLYRDSTEYSVGGPDLEALAHYDTRRKELVGYYDPFLFNTKAALAHEVMHAIVDATSRDLFDFPPWFREGIADCLGNCEMRDGRLQLFTWSSPLYWGRIQLLKQAMREGRSHPLEMLLGQDQEEFMATAILSYAQAWSLCHFLLHEDSRGNYRSRLLSYFREIRSGSASSEDAWKQAFQGIPLEEIERGWRDFVSSVQAPSSVEGMDLGWLVLIEDLDPGRESGGLFVYKILDTCPLSEKGIRPGDVVVAFNGRVFRKGAALRLLREEMRRMAGDTTVSLRVRRDGREFGLTATWENR